MRIRIEAMVIRQLRMIPAALLMGLIVLAAGCESSLDAAADKFGSDEAIAVFLKEQYFEVPEKPIAIGEFEYTLLDGSRERMSANKGKVIFLNFWATWCFPCRKEMPDMQQLTDLLEGESFRMLAVNYGDETAKIERFVNKYGYSFDIVQDKDRSISSLLSVKGLPTTLIIDGKGRYLGRLIGPANWKKDEFLNFFRALSRKQS